MEGMQVLADQLSVARTEIERLRQEVEAANARAAREAADPLAAVKSTIVADLQASREPVFPGSLAIKYNIDYGTVIRAIKELRDSGILDE